MTKNTKSLSCSFFCHHRIALRFCGGVFLAPAWLALSAAPTQAATYALGAASLVVGPSAGSNSVVLAATPATAAWTAAANASWLHLNAANQSGAGNANVVFSYDANLGPTRSGDLAIAGQALTVTQAGSTYVAARSVAALVSSVTVPMGSIGPCGLAVDGAGNAYTLYYDTLVGSSYWFYKWKVTNNTVAKFNLSESGFNEPAGLALDSQGNVYIADAGNNMIKEWTAADSNVTTLVSSVLNGPSGLALDGAGNVYIADTGNAAIEVWTAADSNLTTLVSEGLDYPTGVALDGAGNVYIADPGYPAIMEWTAADGNLTTLVSEGLDYPTGVAVDGAGNVYIADSGNLAIMEWTAANSNVTTLVSSKESYDAPQGVAVDGAGNVYMANFPSGVMDEIPNAFVDTTPRFEGNAAGNDSLPVVLPATENLLAPFAPVSGKSWLAITGITNGAVSFSFTANTSGSNRAANITLLGQTIPVTQGLVGAPPCLMTGAQMLGNGVCQFCFTNTPGALFTVLSATDLSLPLSNWTAVGAASNTVSNLFQFTLQPATGDQQRFYTVRSP